MRSACIAPTTFGVISENSEQSERDRHRSGRERELAFAEEALRDHRRQRSRHPRDQRVAEQDHTQQRVRPAEGARSASLAPRRRAARMFQPIAV
jgi:hypothetical protein